MGPLAVSSVMAVIALQAITIGCHSSTPKVATTQQSLPLVGEQVTPTGTGNAGVISERAISQMGMDEARRLHSELVVKRIQATARRDYETVDDLTPTITLLEDRMARLFLEDHVAREQQ